MEKGGGHGHDGDNGTDGTNGTNGTDFRITTGPAQLTFVFHSGAQSAATGFFRGVVTLPDLTFQTVEVPFTTVDNTATIVVGPPSPQGDYALTLHIHSLTGTLTTASSVDVFNSLNGEISAYSLTLPQMAGQQTTYNFVYDTFLLP